MDKKIIHIVNAYRKKAFVVFLFCLIFAACSGDHSDTPSFSNGEIEITIRYASTRASVPDPGHVNERHIAELDMLIFEQGEYKYRRQPYRLSDNDYRVTLQETNPGETVTSYLFANCRPLLDKWETIEPHTGKTWDEVQQKLIDTQPTRLVRDEQVDFIPLPMWGKISGTISTTTINNWGTVDLLRAVASVDLYVQQGEDSLFELTDLHLYYAPDCGYLAPRPNTTNPDINENVSPPTMKTNLNTLCASGVESFTVAIGADDFQYEGIVYQMYCYDNDVTAATMGADKRFTRAIIAGYYNQSGPRDQWKKSYYPVDFVHADGTMRPLIRNYKYDLWINAVKGGGYDSLEEAAVNYPVDLDSEVIDWNRDDVEIGVQGKYYVSLKRRYAKLPRNAGSTDNIPITYRIYDDIPGTVFSLAFVDEANGTENKIENGIENDYFRVILEHDASGQKGEIKVIALRDYTETHSTDAVTLRFRGLTFEITIEQVDMDESDWDWGGNQNENL